MSSTVTFGDLTAKYLSAPVPYAVLAPETRDRLPLCILLLGAGGTRDSLVELQPLFETWWSNNVVPPVIIATPTAGLDYYIEEFDGPIRWESFSGR